MFAKQSKIAIFALLFSWVFTQYVVLHHQYSQEHIQQTEHSCIAHATDGDDLVIGSINSDQIPNFKSYRCAKAVSNYNLASLPSFQARAPPSFFS